MAEIPLVLQNLSGINSVGRLALWETVTAANATGQPFSTGDQGDICVQITGTIDSATITLRGSNLPAPNSATAAHWFPLTQPDGTDAALTAVGGVQIVERPLWVSPSSASGGGSSDIDIYLFSTR